MDYSKFLAAIKQINYEKPEITRDIKNSLYASIQAEILDELIAIIGQIIALQDSPIDQTDQDIFDEQIAQYIKHLSALIIRFEELEKKHQNSDTETYQKLLSLKQEIETDTGAERLTQLNQDLQTVKSALILNLDNTRLRAESQELSPEFIAEFAKPFRTIRHLQQTLWNAPPIIKKYELRITLELLKHIKDEHALQTQLEASPDTVLHNLIINASKEYTELQKISADRAQLSQVQNLAHLATMILVKRHCAQALECQNQNPTETYTNLLSTLTDLIPDVGASSIIDNVSDSTILKNPNIQPSETTNIARMLYDTRETLGLNHKAWSDPAQMQIMAPSRHFFQRVRFGQEDRRIYAEIRRTNLESDLFMARNIYDIQQFTNDPDNTSDKAFEFIEQEHYEVEIKKRLHSAAENPLEKMFSDYYDNPQGFKSSQFYLNSRPSEYAQPYAGTVEEEKTRKEADDILRRIALYHAQRKSLLKLQREGKLNTTNEIKMNLLASSYTMHNLEKIFADRAQAADKLPCPQPLVTIDKDENIKVEINYFHFSANAVDPTSKMNIETTVNNFMSSNGGSDVTRGVFSGRNLTEILKNIENSDLRPEIKQAFSNAVNQFKKGIRNPHRRIDDLKVTDNDRIAKIRKLIELKYFFDQYKKYLNEQQIQNNEFSSIEKTLSTSFAHISNCAYDKAISIPKLDQICCDAYTWISKIPRAQIPDACLSTYKKSAKIAESAQQRMDSYRALNTALDIKDDPNQQKEAIKNVFLTEYSRDSVVAKTVLDKEQTSSALEDIDTMAQEYVDFSERTERGEFSITAEQEATYLSALEQISDAINTKKLAGTQYQFKLSHKVPVGQTEVTIKDTAGDILVVPVTINSKLPYSLSKSLNSDHLLLSYGGSRGTVAELQNTEKTRYFTGWRIYGIGQYGTVKRADDFITGEGAIIKAGLVAQEGQASTYEEALRQNPLYRNMTSRDDPNSGTERTVLEAIAAAKQTRDPSATSQMEYWTEPGKTKTMHTRGAKALRYKMIQPLAKGKSLKDTMMPHLNANAKGTPEFHRPPEIDNNQTLEDALALSTAIVAKVEEYRALGFSHNDLKPENLMAFKRPNGTYAVDFIDWATGGFERTYVPAKAEASAKIEAIFKKLFGKDVTPKKNPDKEHEWLGPKGQFLRINQRQMIYGIKPNLEILHGSRRNCTLPYIAPNVVLGRNETSNDFVSRSLSSGTVNHHLDTNLDSDQASRMDNWALTALSFGLTNRKAYFILSEGRAVHDYTVPGVINTDGHVLKIEDPEQFNEFFAPTRKDRLDFNLSDIDNPDAAMFIPATLREGQPLHLYQRLKVLYNTIREDQALQPVKDNIKQVLQTVHTSITSGEGLSPEALKTQLRIATECLHAFEQKQEAQQIKQKAEILEQVCLKFKQPITEKLGILLESCHRDVPNSPKNIEILCTYPTLDNVAEIVLILNDIPQSWLKQNILLDDAPVGSLLQLAITYNQRDILNRLLKKLSPSHELNQLIIKQGLLHYALQEGMTDSAEAIIAALMDNSDTSNPGLGKEAIFDLMLRSYGPEAHVQCPYITWNANALHTAIRNNDAHQLALILNYLPDTDSSEIRTAIEQAMYFSADLLNKEIFTQLWKTYNEKYTEAQITSKDILTIHTPDVPGACPLHFLLSESETDSGSPATAIINSLATQLEDGATKEATRNFLISFPYPSVIAAENHNLTGLSKLLDLAKIDGLLSKEDNQSLLQQRDLEGGNLLNHILETKNPDLLNSFLTHPGMNPNILYTLLKNPDPKNPLRQFLSPNIARSYPTDATQTLLTLLRGLGATPENEDSQRPVRNTLLANREWLIYTANEPRLQQMLDDLLGEEWWSVGAKKSLLSELVSFALEGTAAQVYFSLKLQSITPTKDFRTTTALDINREDFTDIHSQRGDFRILIEGLLANSGKRYQKMSEASEAEVLDLKEANTKLKTELENFKNNFQAERTSSEQAIQTAKSEQTKLQEQIKRLEEQITIENQNYTAQLQSLTVVTSQLKNEQQALTDKHANALASLYAQLNSLQSQITEKNSHITSLEKRIIELSELQKKTNEASRQLNSELEESRIQLVQIEGLKQTITRITEEAEGLNGQLLKKEETIKKLQASLHSVSGQLAEAKQNNSEDKATIRKLEQEFGNLENELYVQKTSIDHLSDTIQRLKDDNQSISLNHSTLSQELESELNKTKTLLNSESDRVNKLKDSLQEERLKNQDLNTALETLKRDTSLLETQFNTEHQKSERLANELDQKKHELQQLMISSRSNGKQDTQLRKQFEERIAELEKTLKAQVLEMKELHQQLVDTDSKYILLQQTLENSGTENTKLKTDLNTARDELAEASRVATQKETELLIQIKGLETTIADITREAKALNGQLLEKEETIKNLQASLHSASGQLAEAKQYNGEDEAKIRQLEQESYELQTKLYLQETSTKCLSYTIQHLKNANQSISLNHSRLSQKLESELNETKTLLNGESGRAEQLEKSLQEERLKNRDLNGTLAQADTEISSLGEQVKVLREEVSILTHTLEEEYKKSSSFEKKLTKLQAQNGLNKYENARLHEEIDPLKVKLKDSLKEISNQTLQLKSYQAQLILLREQNSDLGFKNKQLVEALAAANELNETLKGIITEADAKEFELQKQVFDLNQIIKNLEFGFQDTSRRLNTELQKTTKLQEELEEISQLLHAERQNTQSNAINIRELTSRQDELTKQLENSQLEVVTISHRMEGIQISNDRLLAELSNQRSEFSEILENMRSELSESQIKAKHLSLQLHQEIIKNQQLNRELSQARAQISELSTLVLELKIDIKSTTTRLVKAENTSRQQKEELSRVKIKLEDNLEEQDKIKSKLRETKQENTLLKKELGSLQNQHQRLQNRQIELLIVLDQQDRENSDLKNEIQALMERYQTLFDQSNQTEDMNILLRSELQAAGAQLQNLETNQAHLVEQIQTKDSKILSLEEQIEERNGQIDDLKIQCQRLVQQSKAQMASSRTSEDFAQVQAQLECVTRLLEQSQRYTSQLSAENAVLYASLQRRGSNGAKKGHGAAGPLRDGSGSNISSVDDDQSDDEASDTDYNQTNEDGVDLVVENLGAPRPYLQAEQSENVDLTVTNRGKLNPDLRRGASEYRGLPSKRQWPRSESGDTTDTDSNSRHPKNGGESRGKFFGSNLHRPSDLYNNPRRRLGSGRYNSNDYLYDDRRRDEPGSYDSDDDPYNGRRRNKPRWNNRPEQSNSYFSGDSRRHRPKGYDSDHSSSDGPKRHRPKDSGSGYGDHRPDPRNIAALGARTEPARVRLQGRDRELRDVQADIAIAIGSYAEIMSNQDPSDEDKAEVEAKKKILFVFQPEPLGLQIGYRSDAGDYVQARIEEPEIQTLLDAYRDPGDGVVLDPNHLQQISTYLTTTLRLVTSPVENPHPGLTNTINIRDQYVRLNAVDPANPTKPPKRLLDAKLNDVVVYRRLISDPSLSPEWKAQTILKSMGIPPQPQFDFPAALEIDGKTDIADFDADRTRNPVKHAVITRMFEIYNEAKLRYDNAPPMFDH